MQLDQSFLQDAICFQLFSILAFKIKMQLHVRGNNICFHNCSNDKSRVAIPFNTFAFCPKTTVNQNSAVNKPRTEIAASSSKVFFAYNNYMGWNDKFVENVGTHPIFIGKNNGSQTLW